MSDEQRLDSSTNTSEVIEKDGDSRKFVTCKVCNHKCSIRAVKCPKCHTEFLKFCTTCLNEIPVNSKLCPECGDPEPFALPNGTRQLPATNESNVCSINNNNKSCGNSAISHEYLNKFMNKKLASGTLPGGVHHPWRRFFARFIDTFMWSVVLYFIVSTVCENLFISSLMVVPLSIILEATLISITGNTLGKWIFGIALKTTSGGKLLFNQALSRSLRVVFQGAGLGIPIICFFTQIFAYRRLIRTGTTLWDMATETVVSHKEWGSARAILCTLSVLFVLILTGVSRQITRERIMNYIDTSIVASAPKKSVEFDFSKPYTIVSTPGRTESKEAGMVSEAQDTIVKSEIISYKEAQFEELKRKHPDFEIIVGSREFARYKANAPPEIQTKIKSIHAKDAIEVLDNFKATTDWKGTEP